MESRIIDAINNAEKILIVTHTGPDGDAVGSAFGFKRLIMNNFEDKFVDVCADGDISSLYSPMLRDNVINPTEMFEKYDLAIVLDCPNLARTGKFKEVIEAAPQIINIDHHGTNERFGTINYATSVMSSTCEFLYFMAKRFGLEIDKDIAKLLYQGILTDTNCFTSNTVTARTHQALSELLGYKFDANLIKEYYFNNQSLKKTKLEAKVLNSVKLYKNNTVAVMKIPYSDIEKNNLSFEDTMGIVDKGTAIEGVGMSIILIEAGPGYVYVSLRGKGSEVDVSKFAKEFGGGGSNTIAAFQYHGELKDIEQMVHTYIKEKIEVISQDPDEKKLF